MSEEQLTRSLRPDFEIPESAPPPDVEAKLRGAIYSASTYNEHVKITCGYRTVVLLAQHEYDRLIARANADAPRRPLIDPTLDGRPLHDAP